MQPYQIAFDRVAQGEIFHQCVFILCQKTQEAMAAAAAARQAYDLDTSAPYMPHLSLLYADVDAAARGAAVAEEQGRLFEAGGEPSAALHEPGFEAVSVSVWYTPAEDKTLLSWRQLAEFKFELGGSSA